MTKAQTTPTNPVGTREMALEMGLFESEYDKVLEILGREPTLTELGMFAVMWSEHCGYKFSRPVLRLISNYRKMADEGTMENAGVIPLGDGLGVVFKMESHNHPSAVEPVQGAATGVGGILRDIFTMGARPIASLNSLRFGPLTDPRTRFLFHGVVEGIAFYGNCLASGETLIWKDATGVHFDTIGRFVSQRLSDGVGDTELAGDIQALSADLTSGHTSWQTVRRVFRRPASKFRRIRTALGRALHVTEDHPMLVQSADGWEMRAARDVREGDVLPIAATQPAPADSAGPFIVDCLAHLATDLEQFADVFVAMPGGWRASDELRRRLRSLEPSAHKRSRYARNGAFPLPLYLQLEPEIGVPRSDLHLYRSGKANRTPAVWTVDAAFARFIGYYLAEGCASINGQTTKVVLTFAHHESEYVQDVRLALENLGLRVSEERRASTIAIFSTSWLLGHVLKSVWECGATADEKAIPAFVFDQPRVIQREVLKGLLRGDGSLSTRSHGSHAKITFASCSRMLFEQTLALLQNEGVMPYVYERQASECSIQGRHLRRRPLWTLEVTNVDGLAALADVFGDERTARLAAALALYDGRKHSYPRYRREHDLAFVQVQSNEPIAAEDGFSYDVEIDDTHTFVTTGGLITHNCVGVPTVGGEVAFHPKYAGNPLVNAMAIGLVHEKDIARATAEGVGNPVLIVGARTGRDGIHGATFASVELNEESESKRPNVQCGDPFTEKLLIEATLEALATGHIVGIQDFGAAGLTCSTCEMSAKGGTGMRIDVLKVPRREEGMTPYEVMLSESQERMLAVAKKGHEHEVAAVFHKWGLNAEIIGEVTDDGMVTVNEGDTTVAYVPSDWLADRCPTYTLEAEEPAYIAEVQGRDLATVAETEDMNEALLSLLAHPTIASKRWVYQQYDHQVQTNTVVVPGAADAAVLRVRGSDKGLAASADCNGRHCWLDPFEGARGAVAEAARNLACVGARPAAVTDCLNFGNPQKPEAFWQFTQAVRGMAEICDAWNIPIVSGNVSFYNETPEGAILPTPTIGMVGILQDVTKHVTMGFQNPEDVVLLLGAPARGVAEDLGGSEYLATLHDLEAGRPPAIDVEGEAALRETLLEAIGKGYVVSAHDVSDGGYAVALAECCIVNGLGAEIICGTDDRKDAALFGENAGRAIVSCSSEFDANEVLKIAESHGCPASLVGWVRGRRLRIGFDRHDIPVDIPVSELKAAWENAIPSFMAADVESAAEIDALPKGSQPVD